MTPEDLRALPGWQDGAPPEDAHGFYAAQERFSTDVGIIEINEHGAWGMDQVGPLQRIDILRHAPLPDVGALQRLCAEHEVTVTEMSRTLGTDPEDDYLPPAAFCDDAQRRLAALIAERDGLRARVAALDAQHSEYRRLLREHGVAVVEFGT